MKNNVTLAVAASVCLLAAQVGIAQEARGADAKGLRVVSEKTATGFAFPESVGCDPKGKVLYVSDNRADMLYRVEPADFLNFKGDPQVSVAFAGKGVNPNGVYPGRDGSLWVVGFQSAEKPRGIYLLSKDGELKAQSKEIGRLDGVYQMRDGSLLVTDWNSGSLARWTAKAGMQTLASGFKGPADFCVMEEAKGLTVVVPDLAKSELRIVKLAGH